MTVDLKDSIEQNAQGPKQAAADGVSTSQHPLQDQIAADKYLKANEARTDFRKGFTRVKIVAPGTV